MRYSIIFAVIIVITLVSKSKAQTISHNTLNAFLVTIFSDTLVGEVAVDYANKQIQLHQDRKFRSYAFDDVHYLALYIPTQPSSRIFQRYYHREKDHDLFLEQLCQGPISMLRKSDYYLCGTFQDGNWLPTGERADKAYYLWDGQDLKPIRSFKKQIFSLCGYDQKKALQQFAETYELNYSDPQHQLLIIQELNKYTPVQAKAKFSSILHSDD